MFLKGLREGGVPIKFSSWHTFIFSNGKSSTLQLLIQERSRSVKSIFSVLRRTPGSFLSDGGALHMSTLDASGSTTTLVNYQYRIGGRYFPASPVQVGISGNGNGGYFSSGGAEAYVELQKALNTMGDYRLKTSTNTNRWALQPAVVQFGWFTFSAPVGPLSGANYTYAGETDYGVTLLKMKSDGGPFAPSPQFEQTGPVSAGNLGSACFAMATNLETSNGMEISGLNAEEQSDISLIANYSSAQSDGNFNVEVYCFYDAMLILRENNVLELIQ